MIVWECALIGKHALAPEDVVERVRLWLTGTGDYEDIPGFARNRCFMNVPEPRITDLSPQDGSRRKLILWFVQGR